MFKFDGLDVVSMEALLQAFKFENPSLQRVFLAAHYGYNAFSYGNRHGNGWKKEQKLYWQGVAYDRIGPEYQGLLTRAYNALVEYSEEFREALRASVPKKLDHTMGKNDPTDTVLTRFEYVSQLNRVRFRALNEVLG